MSSRYSASNAMWRGRRLADLEDRERRAQARLGVLMNLEEEPVSDPFADFGEPPEPDLPPQDEGDLPYFIDDAPLSPGEQAAQDTSLDALSAPVGAGVDEVAVTMVGFPVVVSGAAGVDLAALEEPARRVAEIVEAIQPTLVPPPTVRELQALVAKANALEVVDAASYQAGCDLYELLAANEKGIELAISPVVNFFYRPWKAMCDFRAMFMPPVVAAKKRLSADCGVWKQNDDARARREREMAEEAAAAEERAKLLAVAAEAKEQGKLEVAETATQMAAAVEKPALPLASFTGSRRGSSGGGGGTSKGPRDRETWDFEILDLDKIYKGMADGTIPRAAAPLDPAWLKRQAGDLKEEMEARYPGLKAKKVGGLTASGRR